MKAIPGNFDKLVDSYISDNEVTQIDEVAPILRGAVGVAKDAIAAAQASKVVRPMFKELQKKAVSGVSKPSDEEEVVDDTLEGEEEDQTSVNTQIKKDSDSEDKQQVDTAPPVKKIPLAYQKQMVDGAINSALNSGVEPTILKKQVRKAIQQVK